MNAAPWLRGDQHPGVARLEWGDATNDLMHPVRHPAKGVVVEARHLAGVDGAVGQHRIPAFPNRCRAHRYRIKPGRAFGLEQQSVSVVKMTCLGQGMGDEWCPREAGLNVVATLGDEVGEPLARKLLIFGIEEPENDGQRVWRLGITVDDAFRLDVILVECGPGAFGKAAEVLSILMTAEKRCGITQDVRVSVEARRRYNTVVRLAQGGLLWQGRGIKPIAELEAPIPQSGGGQQGFNALDVVHQ